MLGFRRYLEDARSHQFSYIDAAGIFREYLPWAVVFGLEQRWAEVFAELDVVAEVADVHLAQDLRWFAGIKGPGDALTPPERRELEGPPRRPALGIAEASEPTVVPAPESGHAVRQWIPRPSVRRTALEPRPRPAMPGNEPVSGPTAPVTPRRPPPLDETVAVLVPSATTSPPRPQPPWSDWLVELDLAMSGDFDVHGPDATDGGTVISGPERFDVLLTPPLWPDIPLDTRPDHRVG